VASPARLETGWPTSPGHSPPQGCHVTFLPIRQKREYVGSRRYTAGEIELASDRRLYISRGVGHLLKVRFNVRPEVTLFELAG
jgi:uncharacterized protein